MRLQHRKGLSSTQTGTVPGCLLATLRCLEGEKEASLKESSRAEQSPPGALTLCQAQCCSVFMQLDPLQAIFVNWML